MGTVRERKGREKGKEHGTEQGRGKGRWVGEGKRGRTGEKGKTQSRKEGENKEERGKAGERGKGEEQGHEEAGVTRCVNRHQEETSREDENHAYPAPPCGGRLWAWRERRWKKKKTKPFGTLQKN